MPARENLSASKSRVLRLAMMGQAASLALSSCRLLLRRLPARPDRDAFIVAQGRRVVADRDFFGENLFARRSCVLCPDNFDLVTLFEFCVHFLQELGGC